MAKRVCLLVLMLTFWLSAAAQPTTSARELVKSMAEKYDGKGGIESMICTKGSGLEMIKMAMRKELGKDFVKGVDIIIIIDYSKADKQTSETISTQIDKLKSGYQQMELSKEMTEGEHLRNYFNFDDEKEVITDMVMLSEGKEDKYVVYFGGEMGVPKSK